MFYHNNNSHIFRELIWKQCRCIVLVYLIFVFQFLQQQKKSSSYLFDHQMYITWQPISEKNKLTWQPVDSFGISILGFSSGDVHCVLEKRRRMRDSKYCLGAVVKQRKIILTWRKTLRLIHKTYNYFGGQIKCLLCISGAFSVFFDTKSSKPKLVSAQDNQQL